MTDQELHRLLEDMSLQEKIDQLLQLTADFYGKDRPGCCDRSGFRAGRFYGGY